MLEGLDLGFSWICRRGRGDLIGRRRLDRRILGQSAAADRG